MTPNSDEPFATKMAKRYQNISSAFTVFHQGTRFQPFRQKFACFILNLVRTSLKLTMAFGLLNSFLVSGKDP